MASVTILSSSPVLPSQPTPNDILPLSESDQLLSGNHVQTIYIYKSFEASSLVFDSLKNTLSQLLVPYYPLAGRLRSIGGGRFELECCAAGVQLIQASSDAKLDDYGDFAPTDAVVQLAPEVDYDISMEELPLLLLQVTRFSCGGLCIGVAMSHCVSDGISTITFVNSWASITRGEKTMDSILKPCHDRTLLQSGPLNPQQLYHQEYEEKPPLLIGRSDPEEERKKEFTVELFKLSKDQVEKLKKKTNDRNMEMFDELQPSPRPYSRFECIAGHMWMSACKARNTGESHQPTVVNFAVDVRRRLRSPLPPGYFGNATLVTITPICEFGDLIMKPLSYAAEKIREGIKKCTDEYVKSALNFLGSQEDIEWTWTTPPFWGNPNMDLTCLISIPLYDADFGWGRPCCFRPLSIRSDGEAFILPDPAEDGSVTILIGLQTQYRDDFKKFFYENL